MLKIDVAGPKELNVSLTSPVVALPYAGVFTRGPRPTLIVKFPAVTLAVRVGRPARGTKLLAEGGRAVLRCPG